MNNTAKMTMQHENGTQITVSAATSLKLALESGYQWINRNDHQGWRQLVIEVRREAIALAVGR